MIVTINIDTGKKNKRRDQGNEKPLEYPVPKSQKKEERKNTKEVTIAHTAASAKVIISG